MINKILYIKNCGKFKNYTSPIDKSGWNGEFSRINTIYAENGSGKTTLTQIFKSFDNRFLDFVRKRKSVNAKSNVDIKILIDHKERVFGKNSWNGCCRVEVFDSYFAEENVYAIDLGSYERPSTFYDIIKDGNEIIAEIDRLRHYRSKLTDTIANIRLRLKKIVDATKTGQYSGALEGKLKERERVKNKIEKLDVKLNGLIDDTLGVYAERINEYLRRFNPLLSLGKLRKSGNKLVYELYLGGMVIRSANLENISLRHVFSEGDKSALSLSFFLARLDMLQNVGDYVIVFDDPVSSFDTQRRMSTVASLCRVARRAQQMFVLSHDVHFIKMFDDACKDTGESTTNLKIYYGGDTSRLGAHELERETATELTKMLIDLSDYLSKDRASISDKRHIASIIRPTLEGFFRLKYYRYVNTKQWLGDFIKIIRESVESSPLARLKPIIDDLTLLNDYSKRYHHSNPNHYEEPIYDYELQAQVRLVFGSIEKL